MKRVVFACPTYGPTEPQADISRRLAIFHAMKHGAVEWAGDSSPDKQAYAAARNNIVESVVCRDDVDGIFWADSDIIFPQDAITRLVNSGKDFITGIYFQRTGKHWPLIAFHNLQKNSFNWIVQWPDNTLASIDACGFGCVYTSIEIFRKIDPPWFEYLKFSEDFDLCLKAQKEGFQLWVDTGLICGHLADPVPVGEKEFRTVNHQLFDNEETAVIESGQSVA